MITLNSSTPQWLPWTPVLQDDLMILWDVYQVSSGTPQAADGSHSLAQLCWRDSGSPCYLGRPAVGLCTRPYRLQDNQQRQQQLTLHIFIVAQIFENAIYICWKP